MEAFTELESKNFSSKEWLVKIDNTNSRPYLFKYHCSPEHRCSILITDTVNVWFEALDAKQLARRWRLLNEASEPLIDTKQENAWREKIARKISIMHTLKPIQDSMFSIKDSRDADLAFELQDLDHKWLWECYLLGPKTSARVISRHLIFPLMTVANLAFTSADSVSECSAGDLQTLVDKVAKAGRRAEDIHIRQTLSRPRVAMTLARLTALFNFCEDMPIIIDEAEEMEDVDIDIPMSVLQDLPARKIDPTQSNSQAEPESKIISHEAASSVLPNVTPASRQKIKANDQKGKENAIGSLPWAAESDGSATEPESVGENTGAVPKPQQENERETDVEQSFRGSAAQSPHHQDELDSDSSSPVPPSKKAKLRIHDSDDSVSGSNAAPSATRKGPPVRAVGVRQPIRRGGRKF